MYVSLPDDVPQGWIDLIEALALLSKGHDGGNYPTHCEHDVLTVLADPKKFTAEEIAGLDTAGFHVNDSGEAFYSFRYGSA